MVRHCSKCGKSGHNRMTCKIIIHKSTTKPKPVIKPRFYNIANEVTPYYNYITRICPKLEKMAPILCNGPKKKWKTQFKKRIKKHVDMHKQKYNKG